MHFIVSVLLFCLGLVAQAELPSYVDASYKQPHAYFYQIEKNGAISYLLGSLHLGIPLSSYPSEIFSRAEAAKLFVAEGDPFEMTPQQSALQRKIVRYPPGHSLDKNISPKSYQKLIEIFGYDSVEKIKPYTPAVTAVLFSQKMMTLLNPDGSDPLYDTENGIDLTLLREARANQKQILFLDDRTQVILDTNESMTADDLQKMLQFANPIAAQLKCLQQAQRSYIQGDDNEMIKYMSKCVGSGLSATIKKRTHQWIEKLQMPLENGNAFVVVGVTHVVGDSGLVSKLQAKGFRVQRVSKLDKK